MGRPTKLTPEIQKAICRDLEIAMPLKYAAEANGISERTVHEWLELGDAGKAPYVAFSAAVTRARAIAVRKLSRKAQTGGKGSSAATWFLERRFRTDFGPLQKVEFTGKDGNAIDLDIKVDPVSDAASRTLLEAALGRETH